MSRLLLVSAVRLRQAGGFSLLEQLLVLSLVITLLVVGVTEISSLRYRYQLTSEQRGVLDMAYFARQLSLGSPGDWALCMVSSANSEMLQCTSTGGVGSYWIIYDDANGDGIRQADEKMPQQLPLLYTQQQLFASGSNRLRFSHSQRSVDSGSILLCHPQLELGIRVIFFQSGSIRLSEDGNDNGIEDRNGSSLLCKNELTNISPWQ